jgi:hypothetical protein
MDYQRNTNLIGYQFHAGLLSRKINQLRLN